MTYARAKQDNRYQAAKEFTTVEAIASINLKLTITWNFRARLRVNRLRTSGSLGPAIMLPSACTDAIPVTLHNQ